MSHDETDGARNPSASLSPVVARLRGIGRSAAHAVDRTRSLTRLAARSSSVRRSLFTRVLAATLCGCLAVWTARSLSDATAIRGAWGPQVTVLTARHDIQPGERLERSDTVLGNLPSALTPPDALRDLPRGATATARILAGEPLVPQRVVDDETRLAPPGTTAIRLELAVGAPSLEPRDLVDILGPRGEPQAVEADTPSVAYGHTDDLVAMISRSAVVLRTPTQEDPTIEVAVRDADVAPVAGAAFTGGVAVVRRSR